MTFKVGDRVKIVRAVKEGAHLLGEECSLLSWDASDGSWETDIPAPLDYPAYKHWWGKPNVFRKIGDDFERGSWDEIERITDWHPSHCTV